MTCRGSIEIKRAYYVCRYCEKSGIPLDESLEIVDRKRTIALDQKIAIMGQAMPFEEAERTLKDFGIVVSARTVEDVTEEAGRRAKAQLEADAKKAMQAKLPAEGAVLDRFKGEKPVLYIQPDGTMTPMRVEDRPEGNNKDGRPGTHRECKVGVLFWNNDLMNVSEKRREVRRKRYVATMGTVDDFANELWAKVMAMAGTIRFQPVVISDGAKWIENMVKDQYPDAIHILDIFHLLERFWVIGNGLFGEKSFQTRQWVKEQEIRLKASDIDTIAQDLEERKEQKLKPDLVEKIDDLLGYIQNHRGMIDYKTYLEKGLMIGSGVIESSNKRVIGLRLKQSGMHWTKRGADAVAHLRAMRLSDDQDWARLWATA